MAIQNISSSNAYTSATAPARRQERSFAELFRQVREAGINDNGDNQSGAGNTGRDPRETTRETKRNLEYIETLHDNVDTLRGEILARVIGARSSESIDPDRLSKDISRLSTRLETLRSKLRDEEDRLSGTLVDVTI